MRTTHKTTRSWKRPRTQPLRRGTDRWRRAFQSVFQGLHLHRSWSRLGCKSQVVAVSTSQGDLVTTLSSRAGVIIRVDLPAEMVKVMAGSWRPSVRRCGNSINKALPAWWAGVWPSWFPDLNRVIESVPLERSGDGLVEKGFCQNISGSEGALPSAFPKGCGAASGLLDRDSELIFFTRESRSPCGPLFKREFMGSKRWVRWTFDRTLHHSRPKGTLNKSAVVRVILAVRWSREWRLMEKEGPRELHPPEKTVK